jgi:RES domain-containing protein
MAVLEIPDDISPEKISIDDLSDDWRDYPAPPQLAEFGSKWALAKSSLLMRVPSAVVMNEFNVLINPLHPDIARAAISRVEKFVFDRRLLRG